MDEIELDNIDKGRVEEEQDREREETSFTERTEETDHEDDYDDIRSRISPEPTVQSETNEGFGNSELARQIQDRAIKKAVQRYDAIQALESLTGTRFSVTYV